MLRMTNVFKFSITSGSSRAIRYILKLLRRVFGQDKIAAQTSVHTIKLKPDRIVAGMYIFLSIIPMMQIRRSQLFVYLQKKAQFSSLAKD